MDFFTGGNGDNRDELKTSFPLFSPVNEVFNCYSSWMQHLTKDILTTKITKATKGSDFFYFKLRALRVLRGQICFFFFGCWLRSARFSVVQKN